MSGPVSTITAAIFEGSGLAELGPQIRPERANLARLREIEKRIADAAGLSAERRRLLNGIALLWHDHLDEAHTIAQEIESADGSLLHAIMHRREPDYSNAKYWFRRVGKHGAHANLVARLGNTVERGELALIEKRFVRGGAWDSPAFVDACQEAAGGRTAAAPSLRLIQKLEMESFAEWLASPE